MCRRNKQYKAFMGNDIYIYLQTYSLQKNHAAFLVASPYRSFNGFRIYVGT